MADPILSLIDRRAGRIRGDSGGSAAFSGAIHNRLTADWILAGIQSADQEVRGSLRVLKQRSRELGRNNPHGSRYLDLKADNVIGDEGIQLQCRVSAGDSDPEKEAAERINQQIEDAWAEWGEVGTCTVDGKASWHDIERQTVVEEARDGDALIRMVPAWRGNRFGFALQQIDPDQLDVEYNEPGGPDGRGRWRNEIRMGVEVDAWGRAIAYHVWAAHPNEPEGRRDDRVRVPADQMIHWFRPYRVGQTRGVPDFAPILVTLKMLAGYEEAELVASRIAAAKGGFFERAPESVNMSALLGSADDKKQFSMEVEPGLFESLPAGWKFNAWDPAHPTSAFPEFRKAMIRTIATGLGVSYGPFSQDWESTSFSASRMDERTSRPTYRAVQKSAFTHVSNPVFRSWLVWSITTGALDLPMSELRRFYRVRWQPRGWEGVDRQKDAQADAMEVRLGVNSRTRIAAERGRDIRDVLKEIAREQEIAAELGVELSTDMSRGGGQASGREESPADDSADALMAFLDEAGLSATEQRHAKGLMAQSTHQNGHRQNGRARRLATLMEGF